MAERADIPALRASIARAGLPELEVRPSNDGKRGSLWPAGSDPNEDIPILSEHGFHFLTPMQTELIARLVNGGSGLLDELEHLRNENARLASAPVEAEARAAVATWVDYCDDAPPTEVMAAVLSGFLTHRREIGHG